MLRLTVLNTVAHRCGCLYDYYFFSYNTTTATVTSCLFLVYVTSGVNVKMYVQDSVSADALSFRMRILIPVLLLLCI